MKEKCDRILWALGLDDMYTYRGMDGTRVTYVAFASSLHFYWGGEVEVDGTKYPDIWAFVREIALQ